LTSYHRTSRQPEWCSGHRIKPGTRQPASNAVPFSSGKGVVPATG
jgi:hypothetical protein